MWRGPPFLRKIARTEAMNVANTEAGTRILMIDDDRTLCQLVKEFLEPFGFRVESAFTGPDGLRRMQQGGIDAVILDVMLPGMDGFDLLKMLRRDSDVPVLMLTSRGDELDRIVARDRGRRLLPKTFSTRELLARLRAVTRRTRSDVRGARPAVVLPIIVGPLRIDPGSAR